MRCRTTLELAAELVEAVQRQRRGRARGLVCDAGYGQDPAVLDRVAAPGLWYLAEVPGLPPVWPLQDPVTGPEPPRPPVGGPPTPPGRRGRSVTTERRPPDSPRPVRVDTLLPQLPEHAGHRDRILDGSNGPLVADCAALRARPTRHGLPGPQGWVRFRRAVGEPGGEPEVKISLRTAPADTPLAAVPADTPLAAVVRVSGRRWPLASCFAEGKSEVGLAPYELRSWRGWPHPMTLVILAHHFLGRRQQRLNQRGGPRGPPAPLEPPVCLDQAAAVCAVPPTPVVLSLAQVRRRRQAVRPRPVLDVAAALDLLLYQQERKAAAYRSHRKRILRQLGLLNPP